MHEFPQVVDSTMLATFRSCPQMFFRSYIEHWKPKRLSVHLHAGKAFAAGVESARQEFYVNHATAEDAVAAGAMTLLREYGDFECPPESAKSGSRMMDAYAFYFEKYPLGADGSEPMLLGSRRAIEFSFLEPLPFTHPITGEPIFYSGRADMIAQFAGGTYVFDEKTTSSLGPSWSRQWDLRSQFTGYCWAARENKIKVDGVIVRGVSILKSKCDTQQAITYRADWEINRWLDQVCHDLLRMKRCWQNHYWDWNLDHACTEYGGCAFSTVCRSQTPYDWLAADFEPRRWDPVNRTEEMVAAPLASPPGT